MNLTTINRLRLGWRSFRLDSLDQMKNSMGNEIFLHVHVRLFLINRMNIPRNFFQNVICLHFTGLTKPKNLLNAVEWVQMTIISILNVDQYERGSSTKFLKRSILPDIKLIWFPSTKNRHYSTFRAWYGLEISKNPPKFP